MRPNPLLILIVIGLMLAPRLSAQSRPSAEGWSYAAGAAMLWAPAFPGSDDYQLMIVPSIRASYGNTFFASVERGIGYNAVNESGWVAGPLLRFDFGREASGKNPFRVVGKRSQGLRGFEDVDFTFQGGFFVGHESGPWSARAELLQGINGHEALTGDLSLDYKTVLPGRQPGPPVIVSTGPRLRWADAEYTDAYFGVSPRASAATGLPVYRPDGGLVSLGWGLTVVKPLRDRWALLVLAGYNRLMADVADSPLVRERGSRHQLITGLVLSRAF